MRPETTDVVLFLGHFHPLLVHLPIGGLVLLGILELLAAFTRWKDAARSSPWILGFVCGAAIISAWCGWMLSKVGGYEPQLLKWHQAAGFSVAGVALVTFVLCQMEWRRAYRVCLAVALVLLVVTSHLGGSITHGRDFLTRYAPGTLRVFLGSVGVRDTAIQTDSTPMQRPVFTGIIEPILRERCASCHGAEKHKAELRLDNLNGLLRGGQDGPVMKVGQAKDSPLMQCMVSALDSDGHMPPEGQPQPTLEEISLIEWWINSGAPASLKVIDLQPTMEIQRLVQTVSERPEFAQ